MSSLTPEPTNRPRILIVDDDRDLQDLFALWCSSWGFDTQAVTDPTTALEVAATYQPQLILLDMVMPNLGGYDVLELLKASDELKRIPVVLLTATATSVPEKVGGLTRGAVDYLLKPLHQDEFRARLSGYLRIHAQTHLESDRRELDAIRQTATFLNHSINNLLQSIQLTSEWAAENDVDDPQAVERHQLIIQNVRAIADIVQRLKQIRRVVTTVYADSELMLDLTQSVVDPGPPAPKN